jgi:hypothetical protein
MKPALHNAYWIEHLYHSIPLTFSPCHVCALSCSCRLRQGAKLPELLICVVVALVVAFAVPRPEELTEEAWDLFAIFVGTILGAFRTAMIIYGNGRTCGRPR